MSSLRQPFRQAWRRYVIGLAALMLIASQLVFAAPVFAADYLFTPLTNDDREQFDSHLADGGRIVYTHPTTHPDNTFGEGLWYYNGTTTQLVSPSAGSYTALGLTADKIYYEAYRNGPRQVYQYDINTGQTQEIITNGPQAINGLNYKNGRISWYESRVISSSVTVTDIWIYDVVNGTKTQITHDSYSWLHTSSMSPTLGDTVLYFKRQGNSFNNDYTILFKYDFSTQQTAEIHRARFFPELKTEGNILAYSVEGLDGTNNPGIGVYDGSLHQLDTATHSSTVHIKGDYVAWANGSTNTWVGKYYKISTGTTTVLQGSFGVDWFSLSENQMLFADYISNATRSDLYVADLATGTVTQIAADKARQWRPISVGDQSSYWFGACGTGVYANYLQFCKGTAPTAPSVPVGLIGQTPTHSSPTLQWDNTANTTSYKVLRDGVEVGTTTIPAFTDTTATTAGEYEYQVKACYQDLCSGLSAPFTIELLQDSTPPVITYTLNQQPNAAGWHNESTTINWSVTDPESTISDQNGCGQVIVNTETAGSSFTCTATSDGGTSSQTTTVKLDSTSPTLSTPSWTINPKAITQSSTLSIPASDNLSDIVGGEYFIGDTDPGEGNGATMSWDGTNLSTTFGTDFPMGVYKINVRPVDNAGNWSETTSDYLVVYEPGYRMTGRRAIVPNLSNGDTLPGLISSGQTDKATFAFSVKYDNSGQVSGNSDLKFKYSTGTCHGQNQQNCHNTELDATSVAWFFTQGTNNSEGVFQGTAELAVDGVTSNVLFRVTGLDGTRLSSESSDHFTLLIYAEGANPNTDNPIYRVSADVDRGNIRIVN